MGGAGRVVGNLIRAGTCRLCGAARDNAPVCSVATGKPATVSEMDSQAGCFQSSWPITGDVQLRILGRSVGLSQPVPLAANIAKVH
jgi:hypothetical protein